ncbi:MAG: putative Rieske (2Fe-2S) ferredoxin [Sphingomonas bacterium]|nr:putative Rieske (2Fe-2S) ferredoxin [Sphingomonas bacterium]
MTATLDEGAWVAVIAAADVPLGAMVPLEIGDLKIAIYNVDDIYRATSNVCTHQFALLTDGWLDGVMVECPLHGGQFDVTDGKAQGGTVTCDLATYPCRETDGLVEIRLTGVSP